MIQKVRIQNFKSVLDLELELGRVNVFIGENGSGKTSVLEGIAMGSAASQDRLEESFWASRGVRVTELEMMKSQFAPQLSEQSISLDFLPDQFLYPVTYHIGGQKELSVEWTTRDINGQFSLESAEEIIRQSKSLTDFIDSLRQDNSLVDQIPVLLERVEDFAGRAEEVKERLTLLQHLTSAIDSSLGGFILFAPENYFLRLFEVETQTRPLGIRGEGLFRHLTELAKESPETLAAISENLQLIDWFEGFSIPNDLQFTERRIAITDRFIKDTIAQIDQRSANEGFLYLLFYFTLFLSKYTPAFFAIDNIDNALNPRLCAKLVQTLVKLAAENDKQAIFTTHNPAVLDGLDLTDDAQRLFVIYRNADGETKARRVMPPKKVEGVEPVRLSEAFVRGYLGGLPQNF